MRTGVAKDKAKDKNVVQARLKRAGARFELSLYRDKVPTKQQLQQGSLNWLEILSAQVVFSNAAKGDVADKNDLAKAFPDMKDEEIFKMILEKGEVLATLEDRNEQQADVSNSLAKLASTIANMTHVRPSAEDMLNTKKKHRLERYSAADIERELKNTKFKFDPAGSMQDQAIDGICAIHAADTVPILRDARLVTFTIDKEDFEAAKSIVSSVFRACEHKVLPLPQIPGECNIFVLVDYSVDVKKAIKKDETLSKATIRVSDDFHIPEKSDGSDDITSLSTKTKDAPAAAPAAKKSTGQKKESATTKAPTKSTKKGDDDDGAALGSLEAELKALQADDSDDDGRGKGKAKGGKAKGKPAPPPKVAPKQPPKKGGRPKDDFDSEDDE